MERIICDQDHHKFHTLPAKHKKLRVTHPCGDVLHRKCPFCNLKSVQDYNIVKRLGTGSYSTVYTATHSSQDSPVVLKVLLKSPESHSLFENEVCILGQINHPNIVKMLNHFETLEFYVLVLEHVPGRELFDIISCDYSTLSRNDQQEIFKQIASAVAYLHSINIAHRDIKAENILINSLKVTLIDFGFAQKVDPSNPLCTDRRGSTDYVSPEIVMCKHYDPIKSDIWSLGVILFTLLTGSLPFISSTTKRTFHKIARGEFTYPEPLSSYPEHALYLVNALLVTNSDKRPGADWILSSDWFKDNFENPKIVKMSQDAQYISGGEESDTSEVKEIVIGPETCIFSGFLMKKGKFSWKRRWTVLQASRLLYYKDEKEYELLGIIEFKDVVSLSKVEKTRGFVFALVTKSKTFYLQAPDESHFDHWMESLRECLNLEISFIEHSDLESDFDIPNDQLRQVKSPDIVLKSGYCKKQSSSLGKPFKKRWFVLRKNGLLTIYKNSGEYVAQTVIDLKTTVAILDIDPISKSHLFCFKIIDLSGTEIIVSCSDGEERSEWIKVFLQERNQGRS